MAKELFFTAVFFTCEWTSLGNLWRSASVTWLQPCANHSTKPSLSYLSCLLHSPARFIIVPVALEELILEQFCHIGNGLYIQLHFRTTLIQDNSSGRAERSWISTVVNRQKDKVVSDFECFLLFAQKRSKVVHWILQSDCMWSAGHLSLSVWHHHCQTVQASAHVLEVKAFFC